MDVLQAIAQRKSTRAYKPDQLPDQMLDKILAAGCAAPVGMARYDTLHLTVIQDRALLARISQAVAALTGREGDPLHGAPTLVLVSSQSSELPPGLDYANASCLIENMLLAATALEVGSVYLWGAAVAIGGDPELQKALGLPAGFKPVASLGLGYAAQVDTAEKELKITIALNRV